MIPLPKNDSYKCPRQRTSLAGSMPTFDLFTAHTMRLRGTVMPEKGAEHV